MSDAVLLQMQASRDRITSHVGSRGGHSAYTSAGFIFAPNVSSEAWSLLEIAQDIHDA
jgi:hypothetical protein